MPREHDTLITEFSHESQRPRADSALHTLRKIASLVKPIMRQRGWRVGTLAEFFPSQQNLLGLNVNHGQKICLRLRYARDDSLFLPLEEVVDTMLHELAHNVHGPHDQKFHALWDQLRDEYEALQRKGYTGEGFLGQGQRLGGFGGADTVARLGEARRLAREAAVRRQQEAGRAVGSGRKLGGRAVGVGEDIREVIARAADRRNAITEGCGRNIEKEETRRGIIEEVNRNGFRTKAEEDQANELAIWQAYMELVQEDEKERLGDAYVPATAENPAGSRGTTLPAAGRNAGALLPPAPPVPTSTKPKAPQRPNPPPSDSGPATSKLDGWTCPICTLFNQPNHLCCDVCGTERPSAVSASDVLDLDLDAQSGNARKRPRRDTARNHSDSGILKPRGNRETNDRIFAAAEAQKQKPLGWMCRCGNFMEREWWTCANCGRMKESSS